MKVGDLVLDSSLGQRGIIIEVKTWSSSPDPDGNPNEYCCLYEDGEFDWAYENELEVVNESR